MNSGPAGKRPPYEAITNQRLVLLVTLRLREDLGNAVRSFLPLRAPFG